MSCTEREPCFVHHALTKTRCVVYETVRSSCQHSLEFGWMEKGELILVAQSMRLWLTIGHFKAKAMRSYIKSVKYFILLKYKQDSWVHKRKGYLKRLITLVSSKSPWWRHIVFFQAFLRLFKLLAISSFFVLFCLVWGFFANSPHNCLADLFCCYWSVKWLGKKWLRWWKTIT